MKSFFRSSKRNETISGVDMTTPNFPPKKGIFDFASPIVRLTERFPGKIRYKVLKELTEKYDIDNINLEEEIKNANLI